MISFTRYCFHVHINQMSQPYQEKSWQFVCVPTPCPLRSGGASHDINIDMVIWSESGRRIRNRANVYVLIQYLSRNPFCSRPVDPLLAALSGSREDICFLHRTPLIHEATSVSLHSAPSRTSSALLFQLKPPRHAVGARAGAVIIVWNVLCFNAATLHYV